jgi:hypothetical protein
MGLGEDHGQWKMSESVALNCSVTMAVLINLIYKKIEFLAAVTIKVLEYDTVQSGINLLASVRKLNTGVRRFYNSSPNIIFLNVSLNMRVDIFFRRQHRL